MIVYRRVKLTGIHLYTWVERGTVRVNYLTQDNAMSLDSESGLLDPETKASPGMGYKKKIALDVKIEIDGNYVDA